MGPGQEVDSGSQLWALQPCFPGDVGDSELSPPLCLALNHPLVPHS